MISTGLVEGAVEQQELARELGGRRRALRDRITDTLSRWLDRSEAERLAAYLSAVQQGISVQARDGATTEELSRIADETIAGIVARRITHAS